jgi:hypothetical protein
VRCDTLGEPNFKENISRAKPSTPSHTPINTFKSRPKTSGKTGGNHHRITHECLSEVSTNPAELPSPCFARTRVLTGHGEFGCHLFRIGKADSDECDTCPGKTDDPIHRVKKCPKYAPVQEEIRKQLRSWPPNLRKIPFIEDSTIFEKLVEPQRTPPTGPQQQPQ